MCMCRGLSQVNYLPFHLSLTPVLPPSLNLATCPSPPPPPTHTQGLSSSSQLSQGDYLLAGGLGGTAFWLGCYPVDVVKSKLQTDSWAAPRYRGMLDCARQVGGLGRVVLWGGGRRQTQTATGVCWAVHARWVW